MTSRCTIFNRVANFCRNILSRNTDASPEDAVQHRDPSRDIQAAGKRPVTHSAHAQTASKEQNTAQPHKTTPIKKRFVNLNVPIQHLRSALQ
ncbi:hypothetical protein [Providencia rettgeri]|uniref:hypothetical protein n=1 Tax=Providencia rettgeri TaxID=587 RepID=UPI00029C1F8D|nr:poly(A) polymerase I [Providencia rettgeri Dmel1]